MEFTVTVSERNMVCRITPSGDLKSPVLCFSLMAPAGVVDGGSLQRSVGGYAEVALPNLSANRSHTVVLCYANPAYKPVNRAWLPLGAYIRHQGGIAPLPEGPAGAAPPTYGPVIDEPALRLMPPPAEWTSTDGSVHIQAVQATHDALHRVDRLAQRRGWPALIGAAGPPVVVNTDDRLPPDGYRLSITPDRIAITASDDGGVFYAGISLLTLIQTHHGMVPCGDIVDQPRYGWRGQHLDCARHFFDVATIKRLLDVMAMMKLNRFHWHFADDEAFRLEVECWPELWQKTAYRGEGERVPGVFGGGHRSGGSYSIQDAQSVIDHARDLGIEVMPEIEVPAHALAINKVIAGLRDPDDSGTEVSVQGYAENTVNPAMPATWTFLGPLIAEIAALFPFEYVHLGCDELPDHTWAGSPAVNRLKSAEQLQTTDDVQGWMMARLAGQLVEHGKLPAAWEEAARGSNGGIGHGALLFSWSGQGPGLEAAKAGYDVVMCPAQHVYLDMAHSSAADDWGAAWAAFVALGDTMNWEPAPASLGQAHTRIKGVQGAFWSEFTTRDSDLKNMLWPRLLGVAAMAWGQPAANHALDLDGQAAAYAATPIAGMLDPV